MWSFIVLVVFAVFSPSFGQNSCTQQGYTYADVEDCKYYYICDTNTTSTRLKCGPNLYWHCDLHTCERQRQGNCCPKSNAYIVGGMEVSCPLNGSKMPLPLQCRNYLQCVNNIWYKYSCNDTQRFDAIRMKCVTARFGRCAGTATTNNSSYNGTTPKPPTFNFCIGNMKIANVMDCTSYYQCVNSKIQKYSCPANETYYNCMTRKCETKRNALCCARTNPSPTPQNCTQNGTRTPLPMSCVKYYECINGTVQVQSCPNNQAFDIWSLTCMSPLSARCALKPALTVCSAAMNGTLPMISFGFDVNVACLKW